MISHEGRFIIVHDSRTGLRVAVNVKRILCVYEMPKAEVENGNRAKIFLNEGSALITAETFDEIGEMIR